MRFLKAFILVGLIFVYHSSFLTAAIPASERAALIAFYNSTGGDNWSFIQNWKTPPLDADGFAMPGTEGTWWGVTTAADHVTGISFYLYNRLQGTLPAELGNLTNLQILRVHWNSLSGALPAELGNLANLQILDLWDNQLTGAIPAELGNLTSLLYMDLSYNDFSGAIPAGLGNLANLQTLKLPNCQLSGAIPAELGGMGNLQELHLSQNQLSGVIPAELANMANLAYLDLSSNQLSGTIPAELGNMANLQFFYLSKNQLSGTIPAELADLANLAYLDLSSNQLSGTIPAELADLANLERLDLGGNQLSGTIPAELGNMANLIGLDLGGNQLSGTIPAELGNAVRLEGLFLGANQLSGTIPVALANLGTHLWGLDLRNNQLTGAIPAELGNLVNLEELDLGSNHLSGSVPSGIGNMADLRTLSLFGNKLSGEIPATFTQLQDVFYGIHGSFSISYNALYSTNAALIACLDAGASGWHLTQTVAPGGVSAVAQSPHSILVSWTPIIYSGDTGGYWIYGSSTSGGPHAFMGTTADKSASSYLVSGLTIGTPYYFVVRAQTDEHARNANAVISDPSAEVTATTLGSGLTISGNAGTAGAALFYNDGTAKTATTDNNGNYSLTVSPGWFGTVTPAKTGYSFTPADRTYTNVVADLSNQDYAALLNAPLAIAATQVQSTSFCANWSAAAGAAGYRLDVASDAGFTRFVPGCNNLDVGNVLAFLVTNDLSHATTYYYRLRAYNAADVSANSNIISVTTAAILPTVTTAEITAIDPDNAIGGGNVNDDGGAVVSARGVCWSPVSNPTLPTRTPRTDGTGPFASQLGG